MLKNLQMDSQHDANVGKLWGKNEETRAELQEELGNYMGQFPPDSRMHLSGSCRLMYIQVPQVVVNLTIMYNGRDFASPLPILLFIYSRWQERKDGTNYEQTYDNSNMRNASFQQDCETTFSPLEHGYSLRIPYALLEIWN
ncbi:hypothetical protein TURU_138451 [Turdus rufiventris]|nr:hypothetical protein TURU_138451 [Turdus rufiventris]